MHYWFRLFQGVLTSAFGMFVQAWCIHKKGPVFSAVYSPLSTVIVAVMEYFILPNNLDTGWLVCIQYFRCFLIHNSSHIELFHSS